MTIWIVNKTLRTDHGPFHDDTLEEELIKKIKETEIPSNGPLWNTKEHHIYIWKNGVKTFPFGDKSENLKREQKLWTF